jgi:amidase
VIPISHSQDTVGPHGRTVADAATVLSAIAESNEDYTRFLDPAGLRGARIGVARKLHTGYSEHTDRVFEQALDILKACGAQLIDDVEIPGRADLREKFGSADSSSERLVLEYEFKANLAQYLATRPDAPVKTLADVIRFNDEHADDEMPYFKQEILQAAEARGPLSDPIYCEALEHHKRFAAGFAQFFADQRFDALVAPTNAPAWVIDLVDGDRHLGGSAQPAAVAGFPLLTVPAGFALGQLPLGLTFMGPPMREGTLIKLAYAFERANSARRSPRFQTSLELP